MSHKITKLSDPNIEHIFDDNDAEHITTNLDLFNSHNNKKDNDDSKSKFDNALLLIKELTERVIELENKVACLSITINEPIPIVQPEISSIPNIIKRPVMKQLRLVNRRI